MTHTPGEKQATDTACESGKTFDLAGKVFKMAVANMFQKRKETMTEEVKKNVTAVSHQAGNIDKEARIP